MAGLSSKQRRQHVAALRFLASSGPAGCELQASGSLWTLISARGPRRLPAQLVAGWLAAGIAVRVPPNSIAITSAGRAHLKRAVYDLEAGETIDAPSSSHAAQHRHMAQIEITLSDKSKQQATVNLAESPLGWLFRRKGANGQPLLTDAQFQAGERLRSDFERGHLRQRVSANWEAALAGGKRGASKGGDDLTDAAIDARARVGKALSALTPQHRTLVEDVCCHLKSITQVGTERAWPKGTARVVLAIALEELARHYGMLAREGPMGPPDTPSRIRAWGDGNHVPTRALPDGHGA